MSLPSVFPQRSLLPPAPRERWGEHGRRSETEPGRSGRRKGGTEGEGGGADIHVLFIQDGFFLFWKFPPAVP